MERPPHHAVLDMPHEYDIVDFRYFVDRQEADQSFIDLTLEKDGEVVALRFWKPVNLIIEQGFPIATAGMVFYDVSSYHLEDIGVEVADFEASNGSITFSAKSVERITPVALAS
ncbi:hypothetical protein [Pseudoduganella violaceinigra]|uniref:hypothetical protein n=1 Tax=Pseudoduganella violaceinigra TaxID=246602 RepID=UPI0004867FB1|nr:hypothetical protein [Pseudoduganella violaceinigra]